MPKVVINDQEYDGESGERLIDVARRNGAHVGFLCDGAGFCQTCTCRVLKGGENLSEITSIEQNWFPQEQLDNGIRLGCQATLKGAGKVEIISRAEELFRQLKEVAYPPDGTIPMENFGKFVNYAGSMVVNQIARFPGNAARAVPMMRDLPLSSERINKIMSDTGRVVRTMRGIPEEEAESAETSKKPASSKKKA